MVCNGRAWGRLRLIVALIVLLSPASAPAVRIATYNLLNYSGADRAATFRAILNALDVDLLVVQEVVGPAGADAFLTDVLNGPGGPGGYARASFADGPDTDNALYYRTARFTFDAGDPEAFRRIATAPTGVRDINRWKLRLGGYGSPAATLFIYSMHLKAGTGQANEATRDYEAALARADANALAAGTNFVYAGDLNVYSSSESAYGTRLTGPMADDDGRAFDPLGRPGTWHASISFADLHTQSTRAEFGGLDDRFDFLLVSASLRDGEAFDYVPGTYREYGNDGQHFNQAIDAGGFNNDVGLAMATLLREASDHLPVLAEFQVPARIAAGPMDFGTAIVGTGVQRTLAVTNVGDVSAFGYVDELDYTLPEAPAGFSGPAGAFAEPAGGPGNSHVFWMDTATAGPRAGVLVISHDGDGEPLSVPLTGTVVTHARPSVSCGEPVTDGTLDFGTHPAGGFPTLTALVCNYGYSPTQAPLDVYEATITGPDAARFTIAGGFVPVQGLGAAPAAFPVAFDDRGAPTGIPLTATLTLRTRDAANIAGGAEQTPITYALQARVASACHDPAPDIDGDGDVDVSDFAGFQACFRGPEVPAKPACACFDADGDADVDVADFAVFQGCYNGPENPPNPGCTG